MWKNRYIAALFAGLAVLAGCQKAEEKLIVEKPEEVSSVQLACNYTLTVEASKGEDTKALDLTTHSETGKDLLNAYWKEGEQVKVYKGGTCIGSLDVVPAPGDKPTSAMLSGSLTVDGLSVGDVLTLLIPRQSWSYTGQNGVLTGPGSIETDYDYATASVTVATIAGSQITTTGGASFANEQSVYRFGFKRRYSGDQIPIKWLSVSSSHGALVRSRSWDGSTWTDIPGRIDVEAAGGGTLTLPYVSLRNTLVSPSNPNDDTPVDTYSFYLISGLAEDENALYVGEKSIPGKVMTAQGKFISAQGITVTKSNLAQTIAATVPVVW